MLCMKTISAVLLAAMVGLCGCGKKEPPESQTIQDVELTSHQTDILRDLTDAADTAYLARKIAEKDPENGVLVADYTRAASKVDAATKAAEDAGIDGILIMGAEAQGHNNASEFLEKREAERRAQRENDEREE